MSAEMDSCIRTIYIRLMDEGTDVWRPAKGCFAYESPLICEVVDFGYDSSIEEWEFEPGVVVTCEVSTINGDEVLIAKSKKY